MARCIFIAGIDVPGTQTKQKGQVYSSMSRQIDTPLLKTLPIKIPLCRTTVRGRLGAMTHMLIVQAITPTRTVNPLIEVPMRIFGYGAAMEVSFQSERPNDWKAQNAAIPAGIVVGNVLPAQSAKGSSLTAHRYHKHLLLRHLKLMCTQCISCCSSCRAAISFWRSALCA
ncbi:hypothetical protein EON65_56360, partial [archaeon]